MKKADPKPTSMRKAFSVERGPGGWVFVTVSYSDDKLVSVEQSEPDLKPIILERFKISALKYWTDPKR